MTGPTRLCPACYRLNGWIASRCVVCGAPLRTDETYEERLIWALDHPDSGTAMQAAQILADRHAIASIEALVRLLGSSDPYRAAAAAGALTAFADDVRAVDAVEQARTHPSVLVRAAVVRAMDRG